MFKSLEIVKSWHFRGRKIDTFNMQDVFRRKQVVEANPCSIYVSFTIRNLLKTPSKPAKMDMPVNVPIDDPNADTEWYVIPVVCMNIVHLCFECQQHMKSL